MRSFGDELEEFGRVIREAAGADLRWLRASPRLVVLIALMGLVFGVAIGRDCVGTARADESAPDAVIQQEDAPLPPGYRWWSAADVSELEDEELADDTARLGRRPLDDSDLEMRELAKRFFGQGPCNRGPGGRCPEAAQPLIDGGDRMARYLIRQYEQSIAEGYQDTATLMTGIGATASETGTSYVIEKVERPRDETEADLALSGLEECRSGRAVDAALRLLDRAPRDDWRNRVSAVRAVEINLREGKLERPDAVERLREISGRADGSPVEREAAGRALRAIEAGAE